MNKNTASQKYYHVGKSPFLYAGSKCNNNCIFCFEAGRNFGNKKLSQLKKEMEIIRKNYDFINIMGREPTLRSDIIDLIEYACKLKFSQVGITTNGRMLAYKSFTKRILEAGLNQIGITVIGHKASIHDWHTKVKGSYSQTLAGIRNILELKNKNLSVLLNIMVTKKNFKYLFKTVTYYVKVGIKEINIGHIMPINKTIKESRSVIAKMSKVVPYLTKIQDAYGDNVKFLFVEYPACVLPKPYRYLAFPCLEENPGKRRMAICKNCDYKDTCAGITKEYLKLYGIKEFKL